MADRINWDKVDVEDPRFFIPNPENPNKNISASTYDPTDPTIDPTSPQASWNKFLTTANVGDVFDWSALGQKGIQSKFTGFNLIGTPMIQTLESPERQNWRGQINPSASVSSNLDSLMNVGFGRQEALFMMAQSGLVDENEVAKFMGATGNKNVNVPKTITGKSTDAAGNIVTTYSDGSKTLTSPDGTTTNITSATTGLASLTASQLTVTNALDEFRTVLKSVGLDELAGQMDTWIKENRQPAEIKTLVRTSKSYAERFPGMAALSAKNQAITEGQYIDLERGYTEILNAYGVDAGVFGTRQALGSYIANQVSAREFEERVNDAAVRVEAQPDVLNALSLYHGLDKSAAMAYLLDPKLGMDVVRKQVRAAEIGAAAYGAGFNQFMNPERATFGAGMAESLVSQIGSEDINTLRKEFGQAAILAQTQAKLASIEGQAYNSDQAIQAAVVGNQQAGLESQRRAAREAARFSGQGSLITRGSTVGAI